MKKLFVLCLLPAALALASVEDKETIRQTYPFASRLDVSNVNGSIRVTAGSGNSIEFVANKRIEAKTQDALEQARREVRLDVQSSGDRLRICVEGPFRDCSSERNQGCRRDCDRDYNVSYDFELQVPASIAVDLKTVNGRVFAKGVMGAFDARSVNGAVTLEEMGGSGSATTVNGAVKLSFVNVPMQSVRAKTVNGGIDAAFPKTLHANLRFKTMNGDVFTNFPATTMASEAPQMEKRDGKTIIRSDRAFGVKIGGGGPEHNFETLNGTIQITER
jgi:DUF4097 and DUF4098 domain-containing protein YvlB